MVPPRVSRPIGAPAKISRHCCRMDSPSLGVTFFLWIARNPLKSPESDEEIQENPRKSKPVSLVFLGLAWVRLGGIWRKAAEKTEIRAETALPMMLSRNPSPMGFAAQARPSRNASTPAL